MEPMRFERTPELTTPTLLLAFSGWNDAGLAATTAVQFVAERLEAKRFYSLDGEDFYDFTVQRPQVRLDEANVRQITWPTFDFLAAAIEGTPSCASTLPSTNSTNEWMMLCGWTTTSMRSYGTPNR